jgi:RNA polymerase sigma-70 factor (ECF subfamily)
MARRRPKPQLSVADLKEMVAAARAGDANQVARTLEVFRNFLLTIARRELDSAIRPKVGASDVVQETLNEAREGAAAFQGTNETALKAWLRTMLLRNLLDARRKYRTRGRIVTRERPLEGDESKEFIARLAAAKGDPASEILRKQESAQRVLAAISRLSKRHQEVIRLRYFDGLSFAEIAHRLGKTEKAARMLQIRALESLARYHDGDDR